MNGNTIGFYSQTQTQTFLSPSNFAAMADISFNIAFKELKIAQIAQGNQLFQLLNYVSSYTGYGFYELSRMLMRKNVNDDFSKVIERFHCGIF